MQKTIENKEINEVANLGIESFVKCTKNAHDEVSGLRSINLNFEIKIDGQLIGKGNNLNINMLTEDDYNAILKAFNLDQLNDRVPFIAMLYTARDKEKIDAWITARARKEKEISDDQADITEDPGKISKKQVKFITKLRETKDGGDELYQKKLQGMDKVLDEIDRNTASELIDQLQLLEDKQEKPVKSHKPLDATEKKTKKQAAKKK